MDLETAKAIVKQYFKKAEDPALTDLLNSTKVGDTYRPYMVAGMMIGSDYRQLIKADVAAWAYDKESAVRSLMGMQDAQDKLNNLEIPDHLTTGGILEELFPCDPCSNQTSDFGIGIMLI